MDSRHRADGRGRGRWLLVISAIWLALAPTTAAFAHSGEADVPSLTSVQEAIAIIRSQPDLMDSISDKIKDALDSNDKSGVDIAKVGAAQKAFEAGDLSQTELLLEQAVGACPGQPVVTPEGIRIPPPAVPCPAPAHLTALDRIPVGGTARPVLLGLAAIAILAGLLLVRRTHGYGG